MAEVLPLSTFRLNVARQTIEAGGVIAYPTEAVWGLGCDPWNSQAVERILELKQRPWEKGLILVAASVAQVEFLLAPLSREQRRIAESHWPGPVTCLIPDVHRQIPDLVRGDHDSVAVRVSDHPLVKGLCQAADMPLVSTSANPAGREPARRSWQVRRYFGDQLDAIVAGPLGEQRQPSKIIDIVSGKRLR